MVSVVRTVVGALLEALLRFFVLRTRLLLFGGDESWCIALMLSCVGVADGSRA